MLSNTVSLGILTCESMVIGSLIGLSFSLFAFNSRGSRLYKIWAQLLGLKFEGI